MHYAGKWLDADQDIFKNFIRTMNDVLMENTEVDGRNQQSLLEDLFEIEEDFKKTLISTQEGRDIYIKFISFIVEEKGNILSARTYFRERQEVFSSKISRCFKERNSGDLFEFHINYHFMKWTCSIYKGKNQKKLVNIFNSAVSLRKVLCENNIPLAINRAKIFWSRIPNSHLEYMDFIQNASEGLMNAIDKFVPPYKAVFRSVAIGRMTLNMLTDHNATAVKFSPTERRILYRANNARVKAKLTNPSEVLEYVNQSFKSVTPEKLQEILSAAGELVSMNVQNDENEGTLQDTFVSDTPDPETSFLTKELMSKINNAMVNIPMIEAKIIRLKFSLF